MSHIVTIQTELRDPAAIRAACDRLKWPPPVQGEATLFSGTARGWLVRLPDWLYPVVDRRDVGPGPVRQLQRRLGLAGAPRPPRANLCGGEGPS